MINFFVPVPFFHTKMAMARCLLFSAALLLSSVIMDLKRAEAQCGGFQLSCQTFAVGFDGDFTAQCKDESGTFHSASINLNAYIGNNDGALVDGSGFVPQCQTLGLAELYAGGDVSLQANCQQANLTLANRSSYDLSNHVVNLNGILNWNYCR